LGRNPFIVRSMFPTQDVEQKDFNILKGKSQSLHSQVNVSYVDVVRVIEEECEVAIPS